MAPSPVSKPHVALCPSSGMGHWMPQLQLAAMLADRGCTITILAAMPTVTMTETEQLSAFIALHPHINRVDYQILPHQKSEFINEDPFFIQFEAIAQSIHLLRPIFSSLTPPLSAIVSDFSILKGVIQIAKELCIPTYTYILTSPRFFWLMVNLPDLQRNGTNTNVNPDGYIELPGTGKYPISDIPSKMFNPKHYFTANIHINVPSLREVKGLFLNTLTCFEPELMEALNNSDLVGPVLPIGPVQPFRTHSITDKLQEHKPSEVSWLDKQDKESVLFICFGNRTALSKDQIHELALGLEKSGCNFLWVLKGNKVDRDDKEGVDEIVGEGFLTRTRGRGMVVKKWVDQDMILGHPSVGGFLSHCGWNSLMEAARLGVPVVGWPMHGDHPVTAGSVERIGLGLNRREWGCLGEKLVDGNQIGETVVKVMKDAGVRARLREIREISRRAWDANGASELVIQGMIESLKAGN